MQCAVYHRSGGGGGRPASGSSARSSWARPSCPTRPTSGSTPDELAHNAYGSLFFIMTGLHGLHVFLGLVAMVFLLGRMRGEGAATQASSRRSGSLLLLALRRHRLGRPLQLPLPPQVGMPRRARTTEGEIPHQGPVARWAPRHRHAGVVGDVLPRGGRRRQRSHGHGPGAADPQQARHDTVVRHGQRQGRDRVDAQRRQPVPVQLPELPERSSDLLRQPLHHVRQPTPVVHRRRAAALTPTCSSCHGNDANGVGPDGKTATIRAQPAGRWARPQSTSG